MSSMKEYLSNKRNQYCLGCFGITAVLLLVILIPISISSIEYYEYGLEQRKSTGRVDITRVYSRGRYVNGPDTKFLKYQADSHFEQLDDLSVFSAGGSNESVGLEFKIDVDLTFLLIQDEIGIMHQEIAAGYVGIIMSRARDAIKNEAIFITFNEYFRERVAVEQRFRLAVQKRWEEKPSVHCILDQFHLGTIQIPDSVATKQLESKVQNERNNKEAFLQEAQLEREKTAVQVNTIGLEQSKVVRTAEAEAALLRAKAKVEASRLVSDAQINGTMLLFRAADIINQEQMTAFTYIRTLKNHGNLSLDVSYLSSDNILRTRVI
jgi:hypothetical protein